MCIFTNQIEVFLRGPGCFEYKWWLEILTSGYDLSCVRAVILFYRESQGFGGEVGTGETRHQQETERDGNQTNSSRQQECLK